MFDQQQPQRASRLPALSSFLSPKSKKNTPEQTDRKSAMGQDPKNPPSLPSKKTSFFDIARQLAPAPHLYDSE